MFKFWIVLAQTFMTRFKSKSFIITTSIFVVFIIALGNIDRIVDLFSNGETTEDVIFVIDETDEVFPYLQQQNELEDRPLVYEQVTDISSSEEAIQEGEAEALVIIEADDRTIFQATFRAEELLNNYLQYDVNQQLQQTKVMMMTEQAGIDEAVLAEIYAPIVFETEALQVIDGQTQRTEEEVSGARGLVYVMLFVLYFAVLTYGQMIATDVANEKTSRVMEILISSSNPVSQMFAKISGIALLGLTQISILIGVSYLMIEQRTDDMAGEFFQFFGFNDIPVSTYLYAVIFFLLGYLLYATLSAMLGSLVSRMEDVGQLMFPVIMLIIVAFMLSMFGLNAPTSQVITVTSFIPFFTPLVMFLRVGLIAVPMYEVLISIGILILTIFILGYIGGRVYRGGVLMYGNGFKFRDFKRATQLGNKDK